MNVFGIESVGVKKVNNYSGLRTSSRLTNSAVYAIINIGEQAWQNIIKQNITDTTLD
jgi:hypothetical protein